jgi:transketolase
MRNAFLGALLTMAEEDPRIVLLTGDLGFMVLEPFVERIPDQFVNVGVAEQNMVGVATGLADAGLIPFVYSIATFASMRAYEFIRDGPLLHLLPVRIVGVGAGLDYGHNGVTHYALEDVAIMRAQPDMTIIAPADAAQAITALRCSAEIAGPIYFRIGKAAATVPTLNGSFQPGQMNCVREGTDVAIIALGTMAAEALDAAEMLAQRNISAAVAVVASVQPPPTDDLAELIARVPNVVTVEAHYRTGGLGSLVSEVISQRRLSCRLVRHAVEVMPRGVTGTAPFLNELFGLSGSTLADSIASELSRTHG